MVITLKDIIELAKGLPEESFEETYEKLWEIKERTEQEKKSVPAVCPFCGSVNILRNGKRHKKQAYLCKGCAKTFVETATFAIAYSHSGETVWKQVIRDTADGVSMDKTAESPDLTHSTVFNMRHKILYSVEQALLGMPLQLNGVCEADETYVLESMKGRKLSADYPRSPRRHGAKASKAGISDEYICVCASVGGDKQCAASAINRATPGKAEIERVFGDKVTPDTVFICDGNRNYDVLEEKCAVAHASRVNKVNGFHSFMKERLLAARGVATIYLNRYNALFTRVFGKQDSAAGKIFEIMTSRNGSFATVATVKSENLLTI
ncbi:MAG: IS1595 family transposase [Spirochaetaceae bacterium]|jgi:transposase-like protein|nr:IS1595 family transposase [Spirochaetaceae bacterium]